MMSVQKHIEATLERLWRDMEDLSRKNTAKSVAEAERIALRLIENPNCRLLYRVRAHTVMSYGNTDYVGHAREAVRLAQLSVDNCKCGNAGELRAQDKILSKAKKALRRAERDAEELRRIVEAQKKGEVRECRMYGGEQSDQEDDDEDEFMPDIITQSVVVPGSKVEAEGQERSQNQKQDQSRNHDQEQDQNR